ncbi:hypothetical protein BX661DRAFT_179779, partial [Kickxella alabastrina]|uniref:uncharacterized protein n=1 Tax=Kickxella alabastrina TaxID=61397 RepID=UPI0022206992
MWKHRGLQLHLRRSYTAATATATSIATATTTAAQPPRAVRGMTDRFGASATTHAHILSQAQQLLTRHNYQPIHTPILEYSSTFERTLGTSSDVVGKELYKFLDSSQQWMTMRPEGTAGIARAALSNRMEMPQRLYYSGPMFRHERPQKGRLRQFEQFGVEILGVAHPAADVECVEIAWELINGLGVGGVQLKVNTLGDAQSREAWRAALCQYFEQYRGDLSEDSLRRLVTNPLRILDSKDEKDMVVARGAPAYSSYLSAASLRHFDFVQNGLQSLHIPYVLDPKLVRGLDYYQHTVWEVTCNSELLGRSQATVLAGGRYDGLSRALGSTKSMPGIGWAAGMERLTLLIRPDLISCPPVPVPILLVPERSGEGGGQRSVDDALYAFAMRVAREVRRVVDDGAYVVHAPVSDTTETKPNEVGRKHPALGKQLALLLGAEKNKVPGKIVIVGTAEMECNSVIVRDTASQTQLTVGLDSIRSAL